MGYQIITKMVYNARTHQIEMWQTRKWRKAFETLFREYPELRMDSYQDELKGKSWPEHCAVCRKFEELTGSKSPHEPQSAGANSIQYNMSYSAGSPSFFALVARAFEIAFCLSITAFTCSINVAYSSPPSIIASAFTVSTSER